MRGSRSGLALLLALFSPALLALLAAAPAFAQSTPLQGGPWAPGHAPMYVGQGSGQTVVQDSGPAGGGGVGLGLSELLVTARGVGTAPYIAQGTGPLGTIVDYYDAPTTNSAGFHWLGFSPNIGGNAVIATGAAGGAAAQGLCFNINGTQICLPSNAGTSFVTATLPVVNNDLACWSGTGGTLKDCGVALGAGTQYGIPVYSAPGQLTSTSSASAGQILIGQTAAAPAFETLSGDVSTLSANGVLTLGKLNGVAYPASPTVGTAPYVSSTNTITYGAIPVTAGGTGDATLAAGGVLIGNGTSGIATVTSSSIGLCLQSQGAGQPPIYNNCAAGTGSAGGSNTQVQYNSGSSLAGSANFTWVSPLLTIGQNAVATGQIGLANGGGSGATVTIQNNAATSAYNFNLPANAGTSGLPLLSGGGTTSPMTFGTLAVNGGGTNCSSASGTCLDNITGFASIGFINRTGAGTYAFANQIALANGGTSANLTASLGGIVYSTASALSIISGTATANQVVLSGANAAPAWSTATYPATTTINQLLYSSSANTIAGLATANNAMLATSGSGVPSLTTTPQLGASGTLGSIAFGNATSGVVTLNTVTGALGTVTASLPANGGIIAETNYAQTWSAAQTFTNADLRLLGTSTGYTTLNSGLSSSGNNTLTLPTTATDTLAGIGTAQTWSAAQTFTNADLRLLGTSTGYTTLNSGLSSSGNNTLTLPTTATDTLAGVGTAQTWTAVQTFTNSDIRLLGSSTGYTTLTSGNAGASNYTWTVPGVTDTFAGLTAADQTLSGGANVTSGSLSTGNITVDCGKVPLQYITGSTSAWTITAPTNDGSCALLVTNPSSSVTTPSFSGFSVGSNTGDTIPTTASYYYMIYVVRINAKATYSIKALQ